VGERWEGEEVGKKKEKRILGNKIGRKKGVQYVTCAAMTASCVVLTHIPHSPNRSWSYSSPVLLLPLLTVNLAEEKKKKKKRVLMYFKTLR